jgi:SAM-dependent methyltransferase
MLELFEEETRAMLSILDDDDVDWAEIGTKPKLQVASSLDLPVEDDSVDLILTSPPYCTRIDYAVATMPELAVLGFGFDGTFRSLRKRLIGTSTVPKEFPKARRDWGATCNDFLLDLESHSSKSSDSYYYKNHLQYFGSMLKSVRELERVLTPGGICILVVQDSYYKDVHNDLPKILEEMASECGLQMARRDDFVQGQSMAQINSRARKYRDAMSATESVLCFTKYKEEGA